MNSYSYYTVTPSISQEYGESLQGAREIMAGVTSTQIRLKPVKCGAMTVIGVSPLQGKSAEGRGKASKANIHVKSRGDVRCLPQANMHVKSRGGVRLLGGREIHVESTKGAKWLLS